MAKPPQEHIHWKDLLVDSFPPTATPKVIFPNSRLRVLTRIDQHDGTRNQHDHDYFELVLVRSGQATHLSLYGTKPVKRGDVLILPPRVWHRYQNCRGFEIFNCCIGVEIFHQYLPFHTLDPFWSTFFSPLSLGRQSQWSGSFRLARHIYAQVDSTLLKLVELTQEPFVFQTNYQILGTLMVAFGQLADGLHDQVRLAPTPSITHPIINRAIAVIEETINRDWRVSELCTQLNGINAAYFIRLFKKNTGLTPKAYIVRRRIEKAAHRLLTTQDSVTEIAIDLGWNDPNLFSRTFRQFFSASPTEYRASHA
jgi:AraC family transcriptional regulator, L-rhamnose operon transcriptional activator RhaR